MLTVYGIETGLDSLILYFPLMLQQCLPFTVLKLAHLQVKISKQKVATVLTVYGIETLLIS